MDLSQLFPNGLPTFTLIILALTYLLWAKFLNGGKLSIKLDSPDGVNKITELLSIFCILIFVFFAFPIYAYSFDAILALDFTDANIDNIMQKAIWFVNFMGFVAILFSLALSYKKETTEGYLHKILLVISFYILTFSCVAVGILLWSFFTVQLPTLIFWMILLAGTSVLGLSVINYLIRSLLITIELSKGIQVALLAWALLATLGTLFLLNMNTADFTVQSEDLIEFEIRDAPFRENSEERIYEKVGRNISVESWGEWGSLYPWILLPLDGYSMDKNNYRIDFDVYLYENEFRHSILSSLAELESDLDENAMAQGIVDKKVFGNNLMLKFDREIMKNRTVFFRIEGTKETNITEEQLLVNFNRYRCQEMPCKSVLIARSNLTKPVLVIDNERLLDLEEYNLSTCEFVNISASLPEESEEFINVDCREDWCDIEQNKEKRFDIRVKFQEHGLEFQYLRLPPKGNFHVNTTVDCLPS